MHKITMYEGIVDKIDAEMENINKSGIQNTNLDQLYKLSMSLKAIDKHIECLEEKKFMEENPEYEPGMSSRGRRRNTLGQYSRDGWNLRRIPDYSYDMDYPRMSYDGRGMGNSNGYPYSYAQNPGNTRTYSRDNAKMKMVNKLETLMDDTMSEQERNAIRNCINEINLK